MDPQQRSCWRPAELVEDAGLDPHTLRGTETGVSSASPWHGTTATPRAPPRTPRGTRSPASRRPWRPAGSRTPLGLEGPPSPWTPPARPLSCPAPGGGAAAARECATAIVRRRRRDGGGPRCSSTLARQQRALAADGRAASGVRRTADGFGFGEGVAVLLLERSRTRGATGTPCTPSSTAPASTRTGPATACPAPSRAAQRKVIEQALANAGIAPGDVDAVEAHGTGTTLGRPHRGARPARHVRPAPRDARRPLLAGLREVEHRVTPRRRRCGRHPQDGARPAARAAAQDPARAGSLRRTSTGSSGAVALLAEEQAWPRGERPGTRPSPRSASAAPTPTSSSGEAPGSYRPPNRGRPGRPPRPRTARCRWSSPRGPTKPSARPGARRLSAVVADETVQLPDLGLSLAVDRARHEHRAVVLAGTREAAALGIGEVADGRARIRGTVESGGRSAVFLFPGQGSQSAGMAADLLEWSPVFAEVDPRLRRGDGTVAGLVGGRGAAPGARRPWA